MMPLLRSARWAAPRPMATFVRNQEIEHEIGPGGRFSLRVTSSDVELRGVEGTTARVRVEFDLRGANDAEVDEAATDTDAAAERRSILERLARKEIGAEEAAAALRAVGGDR